MPSWTSTEVIQLAPEMAQIDPAIMDFFIEMAAEYIDTNCVFRAPKDKYAGAVLTAHLLAVTGQVAAAGGSGTPGVSTGSGLTGGKSAESVGDVSVSYGNSGGGYGGGGSYSMGSIAPGMNLTPYGLLFTSLIRLSGAAIQVL